MKLVTVNRGKLFRDAVKGKLLARTSFEFDALWERQVETTDTWREVKVVNSTEECEDGKYNIRPFSFKSKSGMAYRYEGSDIITLHVHSNHIVELRYAEVKK